MVSCDEIRNQEPKLRIAGVPTFRKERERWGTLNSLWALEQHNSGVEEAAGDARANGDQIALAGEDFDFPGHEKAREDLLAGRGECGKPSRRWP